VELNCNSIPFDPRKPFDPSGLRLGTASLTSRGMEAAHMEQVAAFIDRGVEEAAAKDGEPDQSFCDRMRAEIREFLAPFPAPGLGAA
jgi:glycine hydroxymethyltransferase